MATLGGMNSRPIIGFLLLNAYFNILLCMIFYLQFRMYVGYHGIELFMSSRMKLSPCQI